MLENVWGSSQPPPPFVQEGLIDDQSRGNNKQSGYVYVYERAKKIVKGIVDKFCLFFSSIKSCKSATWQRHS